MGLIPTLLNMYHRNKRYGLQKSQYEADKAEREEEKRRQQAMQTLNSGNQPDIKFEFYDPYRGYQQQIGR